MIDEEQGIKPLVDTEEQPETLLDQLAAKRKEISENKETFLPVPGYDKEPPLLLIKYRLLDGPDLAKIGQRVRKQFKGQWDRQLFGAIDTFIAACLGIYVDLGDGNPKPLTVKGEPVTGFTRDLAEGMEFADELADADVHRNVVIGLFAKNDVAISQHNYLLSRWMADTSIDVSSEMFEGNL